MKKGGRTNLVQIWMDLSSRVASSALPSQFQRAHLQNTLDWGEDEMAMRDLNSGAMRCEYITVAAGQLDDRS